jgi:hypothetical protein
VDKGDAGDLTSTRGRKRKMADRESPDTWTTKKCKVSYMIKMIIASLTIHVHVERNQLQNQRSCGEKKAKGEDIRKSYLAVEY